MNPCASYFEKLVIANTELKWQFCKRIKQVAPICYVENYTQLVGNSLLTSRLTELSQILLCIKTTGGRPRKRDLPHYAEC